MMNFRARKSPLMVDAAARQTTPVGHALDLFRGQVQVRRQAGNVEILELIHFQIFVLTLSGKS